LCFSNKATKSDSKASTLRGSAIDIVPTSYVIDLLERTIAFLVGVLLGETSRNDLALAKV
jgi:hypothetical protein